MVKATYNDVVLAESDEYQQVEGNIYFPPGSVNEDYFVEAEKTTTCPWKGEASYYHIVVDEEQLDDAAWYYPDPSDDASHIEGYVAFYTDRITVTKEES